MKSRCARTLFVLAATVGLAGFGAATASAETPGWVPEPTPAGYIGSASVALCVSIPTPIPFLSFNFCF